MIYAVILVAATSSAAITWCTRWIALRRQIVDIPNSRSSHDIPTPRGGGVGFVLVTLFALVALSVTERIDLDLALGLGGAIGVVAAIGLIDDAGHVPAAIRLLVHFAAAGWSLYWIDPIWTLDLPGGAVALGWIGWVLAVVWIVWAINFYNFMDGIDGIAATEAITVLMGAMILLWLNGHPEMAFVLATVFGGCIGFLYFNWPPARIFMGDIGSSFLGCFFGALAVISHGEGYLSIWVWLILLSVFLVDSTVTLIVRLSRGLNPVKPHRSHAYQKAARRFQSHRNVTITVGVLNLLWLLPLAWVASVHPSWGIYVTGLAWTSIVALIIWFRPGAADASP